MMFTPFMKFPLLGTRSIFCHCLALAFLSLDYEISLSEMQMNFHVCKLSRMLLCYLSALTTKFKTQFYILMFVCNLARLHLVPVKSALRHTNRRVRWKLQGVWKGRDSWYYQIESRDESLKASPKSERRSTSGVPETSTLKTTWNREWNPVPNVSRTKSVMLLFRWRALKLFRKSLTNSLIEMLIAFSITKPESFLLIWQKLLCGWVLCVWSRIVEH